MEDLKYGQVRGGDKGVTGYWAAAQAVKARSGRFVYNNAGAITLCGDGENEVMGHAEESERTPATGEAVKIVTDPSAIYRIPVMGGTYGVAMQGKTCDLKVANGIQGANLEAADDDVFVIVDGDLVNNDWVHVQLNQKERAQSGVV